MGSEPTPLEQPGGHGVEFCLVSGLGLLTALPRVRPRGLEFPTLKSLMFETHP